MLTAGAAEQFASGIRRRILRDPEKIDVGHGN